jgi:hypothetical protein
MPILYKEGNVGIGISDPGKFKLNVQGGDNLMLAAQFTEVEIL